MRFLSLKLGAFIAKDLWLRNAPPRQCPWPSEFARSLAPDPRHAIPGPTEINFVLVALRQAVWDGLVAEGLQLLSRRGAPSEGIVRIACAFDTREEDVDALL